MSFDFDVEDQKNTSVFLFSPEGRLLGLVRSRGERSRSRTDKHVTVEDLVTSQPAGWRDVSQQRKSSGARSRTPRMKPRTEGLTPPMEFKKIIISLARRRRAAILPPGPARYTPAPSRRRSPASASSSPETSFIFFWTIHTDRLDRCPFHRHPGIHPSHRVHPELKRLSSALRFDDRPTRPEILPSAFQR